MLITQQKLFKKFWYPTVSIESLKKEGLAAFTLLAEKMVIWLDENGKPAAAEDRCCHRTAKLSNGRVENGILTCSYHGWKYNRDGACICVPQLENKPIPSQYKIQSYKAQTKYGYVWVCLSDEDPVQDILHLPEADDPDYRLIHEFDEVWNCSGFRIMENEMDLAHPAFVHPLTFGDQKLPESLKVEETPYGIRATAVLGVANPDIQQKNTGIAQTKTTRTLEMEWIMPITCKLIIQYPNNLKHIIVMTPTPIEDGSSRIIQFCLRNDRQMEDKIPAHEVIRFDRLVTLEDKKILEGTDYDFPLDVSVEKHLATDAPGIQIRRKILALLKAHNEVEVTGHLRRS